MSRFINPFTDTGFKKIFGQEISKELLVDFLNSLLVDERVIRDVRFLNNEQLPEYDEGRGIIYDIYCTTDTGEHIIVEMQGASQVHFIERTLYYMSRVIVNQGVRGDGGKYDIKAVYGVFFMNFRLRENSKMRIDVILADRDTGKMFNDKLRQIFITLPLFDKEEEDCATDFERWIYVLKNMKTLERMPFKARKAVFEKLEEIADVSALSPEERSKYEQSLKVYHDYEATMEAKLKEGREEGIELGVLKTAKKMKSQGYSVDAIHSITELPIEEIEKL